jgi:hypothetical protein
MLPDSHPLLPLSIPFTTVSKLPTFPYYVPAAYAQSSQQSNESFLHLALGPFFLSTHNSSQFSTPEQLSRQSHHLP